MKNISKKLLLSSIFAGILVTNTMAVSSSKTYDPDLGYLISIERIEDSDGGYTIEKVYTQTAPTSTSENLIYDENYGFLISSQKIADKDGGYTIIKTYTNHSPDYYADRSYGTDTFVKTQQKYTAQDVLLIDYQLTATFDWNHQTKITRVYNAAGQVNHHQDGMISNQSVTISASETEKSSATYRFTHSTDTGTSTDYTVQLYCDYNGKNA